MNKKITEKKFRLATIPHLVKFVIIIILLFGNLVAADAQSTAKSKDKNTAKYQGTLTGEYSGRIMGRSFDGLFSLTISADGVVSGIVHAPSIAPGQQPDIIKGTLSPAGELNTRSSNGSSVWNGQLSIEDGRLFGSGIFEWYGSTGSWQSK